MINITEHKVFLSTDHGVIDPQAPECPEALKNLVPADVAAAREGSIAAKIMRDHNVSADPGKLRIHFDALISHDITYVGIIQTARASGLEEFPLPYALTNCHNSLCAVGGTINEDDHVFGLSAAKKYGGIYVPPHMAVIHQYAREMMSACGSMILGSDSHTRYGCFGTMAIGEGGPELVKQLLNNTYDINTPDVILIWLENEPRHGVGPHDVALALVKAVFKSGFVKNKVLEFAGPGVSGLSMDFRAGIDVMTTETTCLSSIWNVDGKVKDYFEAHGRPQAWKELQPDNMACYDGLIRIDLSTIEPMIALPFHPSNAFPIREFLSAPADYLDAIEKEAAQQFGAKIKLNLREKIYAGGVMADQGIIAGCAGGTFENLSVAADILRNQSIGTDYFSMSVYPSSMPVGVALMDVGVTSALQKVGVVNKTAFCGPCFGAGDVPSNNAFSIRHTTRNFPNREGSKPDQGQLSLVALMDARSIAASAANGGFITPATEFDYTQSEHKENFDPEIYRKRVYNGYRKGDGSAALRFGPNIADWPPMYALSEDLLLKLAAVLHDPVTTTDELIPSGETSSYRSNPLKLAEFTLSRREPAYVNRAKAIAAMEKSRREGNLPEEAAAALSKVLPDPAAAVGRISIGSAIFAEKPGDGSAREQAASCQKVLGGFANIAREYATKRYRSNCINWGILPFQIDAETPFDYQPGDYLYIPNIRKAIETGQETIPAQVIQSNGNVTGIVLYCKGLTADEKQIILDGCLMNYYAAEKRRTQ